MSLRERAARHVKATGTRPALDVLIDGIEDEDEKADVLDLLRGEPLLPHSVVARTLNDAYHARFDRPINGERIRHWRVTHGIA